MAAAPSRLRILLLTPQLPYPPREGRSLRNYNLLRYLASRHQVSLLSFATPGARPEYLAHLRELCQAVETVPAPERHLSDRLRTLLTSGWPDMAWRLASPDFGAALLAWLAREHLDVLQVEGIEMARYLWQAAQVGNLPGTPAGPLVVFDDHNAEYLLQKRAFLADARRPRRWAAAAYSLIQWRRLRRFERQVCLRAQRLVAVSDADAQALTALDARLRPIVVPNGVDLEAYRPAFPPLAGLARPSLVFTGKMDFRPNIDAVLWFAQEVLPRVWERCPTAHLYVVGQSPSSRLDVLRAEPRITITGEVDDTRPYIAGADVYVVPLRVGGGTRLKVLEAMAMGRPIVSTRLGVEGLGLEEDREALLADVPEDFARQITALLDDRDLGRKLGEAARAFAERSYGWQSIGPRLEAAYGAS